MGEYQKLVFESWLKHAEPLYQIDIWDRYLELTKANEKILEAQRQIGMIEELESIEYEDMASRLEEAYIDLTYLSQYSLGSGLYQRVTEADTKLQYQISERALSKLNGIDVKDIKVPNNGKLKSNVVCVSEGDPNISEKVKKELTLNDFTSTMEEEKVTYVKGFAEVIFGETASVEKEKEVEESLKKATWVDFSTVPSDELESQIKEVELATYLADNVALEIETVKAIDVVQGILDVAGMIPVIGEPCDAINGCIYLCRGKYVDAGLSFVGLIPVAGIGATGVKLAKNAKKGARLIDGAQTALKVGDDVLQVAGEVKKTQNVVDGLMTAGKFGTKVDPGDAGKLLKGGSNSSLYGEFSKLKTPEDRYAYLLDKAKTMDVSTPKNGAIFYAGRVKTVNGEIYARQMAERYADQLFESKGVRKYTLEKTPGGKWMDDLQLYKKLPDGTFKYESLGLSKSQADNLWNTLSGRYADGASGAVTAFAKNVPDSIKPITVFYSTEFPKLRFENDMVTHINIR